MSANLSHTLTVDETLAAQATTGAGLTTGEALRRLKVHGPNIVASVKRPSALKRFGRQFANILIWLLIASGAVSAFMGHLTDAGVILGVVLINAVIGYIQEGKAEKSLAAIRDTLAPTAVAVRDGTPVTIPAVELVPGDVLLLKAGDRVGADARVIEATELAADESLLTGESLAADKNTDAAPPDAPLGERVGLVHASTLIVGGVGRAVVVATGKATEIGKIGVMLDETEGTRTPLIKKMEELSTKIAFLTLGFAALAFAFGHWVRGMPPAQAFMAAVSIAVAAIPEGLPAVLTIALAIGVRRMAARNAIIRRLPAVETLGALTVICSDKTGTFTENKMTVVDEVTAPDVSIEELYLAALNCGDYSASASQTENAIKNRALTHGFTPPGTPPAATVPFTSSRKYMAALDAEGVLTIKGAPERILELCLPGPALEELRAQAEAAAQEGKRVICVAGKKADLNGGELTADTVGANFTPLGIFKIIDPERPGAREAVALCLKAGIKIKMITGDHPETAATIARNLGLGDGATITGAELERMSHEELVRRAGEITVYARTSPGDKLRIIEAYQANGEIVAMTGDGVNDAPALKKADIGIGMGKKGTEAAKEASQMVLADDNFATIAKAVESGRGVYENIKKSIAFVLPTNIAEGLVIVAALVMGLDMPITPVQILWVNMVAAVTLALALAFEPTQSHIMDQPPRSPAEPLITGHIAWRIAFVSTLSLMAVFGAFLVETAHHQSVEYSRTVAVNALIVFQCCYLLNARRLTEPSFGWKFLKSNPAAISAIGSILALQVAFTYLPPLNRLFGSAPIDAWSWGRILAASYGAFWVVEAEKWLLRRRVALKPSP